MLLDDAINVSRDWRSTIEDARGAYAEWEIKSVAESIGKKELGHTEASIGLAYSKNILGVQFGAEDHIVVQMNAALRLAGAAGRVEPKCRSIRTRGLCLKFRRCLRHQLRQAMHPSRRATRNDNMGQVW